MKVCKIAFPLILCVSIFSCKTTGFSIPGESQVIEQNLAAEYAQIAEAHEKLKNYESAVKYYQMSLDAGGSGNALSYKIARCYALAQDWENARKMYCSLLEEDPDNTNIKLSIAYLDAMSGDFKTALEE
ncbi:MAG: tetratricopeptide repeat protein, partial [Treponema sp.]|nr:tetratricopeptide repeat protein [Treponema sp.]